MFKKKISELIHGKIEIKKFNQILSEDNKVHRFDFQENGKDCINLYSIKNARIIQSGNTCFSILQGNSLIEELCFQSKNLRRIDLSSNKLLKNGYLSFFPKKIKGTSVCLLQDISLKENYFHFLYDGVVKLHLVEDINKIDYDSVLVPSKKKKFHKQIIEALGLKSKAVDCENFEIIDVENLIVVDHPYWKKNNSWFDDIENIPEWAIKFLRKKFLSLESKQKFKNKIFIDRSDSISPYNQIENNAEVKDFLITKGFEVIQFSLLTFDEQVEIFKNADIIIGAHGSAFANLAFCKPKIKLIEFRQSDHHVSLEKISKINKFEHKVWLIKTNINGKMFVDLKKLENYI